MNESHLEGYGGNVRLHANHVAFGPGFGAKKIILPDIEKADREYFSIGPPKIMDQTLGPCTPPGKFLKFYNFHNFFISQLVLNNLAASKCFILTHSIALISPLKQGLLG